MSPIGAARFSKIAFMIVFIKLSTLLTISTSYNLEQIQPIIKRLPISNVNKSYFGYSISLHKQDALTYWLLAGAPRYSVNGLESGAVFRCPLTNYQNFSDCQRIDVDDNFNIGVNERQPKFGQWLGASVATGGPGHRAIVCAPRFQNIFFENGNYQYRLKGKCKILNTTLERFYYRESYDPFILSGSIKGGNVQLGWSSAFSKDYVPIIGAPGASYAQNENNFEGTVAEVTVFIPSISGGTYKLAVYNTDNNAKKNNANLVNSQYDDTYVGYSVTSGRFMPQMDQIVAAGAPRANVVGQVKFYERKLDQLELIENMTLTGHQIGERFGTSLVAVDLNNDNYDDLVVGSPYYSEVIEEGRIYIYLNDGKGGFVQKGYRNGRTSKGAFGLTVASIGDIDQDGYNDIAVGAPFGGVNNSGAIFIYRGDGNIGLKSVYSQMIDAASISKVNLFGFGISISGKVDIDQNGYPDLAVGAYDSDTVLVFRTRPILTISTSFTLSRNVIRKNELKSCSFKGDQYTCLKVTICFKYHSKNVTIPYKLHLSLEADTSVIPSRVFFSNEQNKIENSVQVTISQTCDEYELYVKNNIKDIMSDIVVTYKYSLARDAHPTVDPSGKLPNVRNYPVLSADVTPRGSRSITFEKTCLNSSVCIPNLHLVAAVIWNTYPAIVTGVTREIAINFKVNNTGDDAFNARLLISLPADVTFLPTQSQQKTSCNRNDETKTVDCPLGNPLTKDNGNVEFRLNFDVQQIPKNLSHLRIEANVTSIGKEKPDTMAGNQILLNVNVTYNTTLSLSGKSEPDGSVSFSGEIYGESSVNQDIDIGHIVTHRYSIRNDGPGVCPAATFEISWPSFAPSGKHLLYLIDIASSVNTNCTIKRGLVNSLQIPILQRNGSSSINRTGIVHLQEGGYDANIPATSYTGNDLNCNNVICRTFTCDIGFLAAQASASIIITSRLWNATLLSDYAMKTVKAPSSLKFGRFLVDNAMISFNSNPVSATTEIAHSIGTTQKPISSYIYVLSIVGGLIALSIVVFILYLLGFFERSKPQRISIPQQRTPDFRPSDS